MANRTNHTSSEPSITTSQTEESEREQERRYGTRYGIRKAPDAARELVERSWSRLRILEDLFEVAHHDGDGFIMTGYSSQGIAAILGDISHDMYAAFSYYLGEDPTPGKEYDAPEVGHE